MAGFIGIRAKKRQRKIIIFFALTIVFILFYYILPFFELTNQSKIDQAYLTHVLHSIMLPKSSKIANLIVIFCECLCFRRLTMTFILRSFFVLFQPLLNEGGNTFVIILAHRHKKFSILCFIAGFSMTLFH